MEIRKTDRSVDELLDGAPIEIGACRQNSAAAHLFSLLIPDITHEERQLLDEALIKTYNVKGITHDNDTLTDPDDPDRYREMPILGNLDDILITAPETKRPANILNRLVQARPAPLTSAPMSTRITNTRCWIFPSCPAIC